jgi:hypothetical protein
MREKQPRLLVIWGKYDLSFDRGEPKRYRKDAPNAEVHVLDASRSIPKQMRLRSWSASS